MGCDHFELPTQDSVRKACAHFDADEENKLIEPALADLFAKYPSNTSEAQVLLKVITLNLLYATQIPTRAPNRPNVFDLAKYIPKLKVDQGLKERSLQIVNTISTAQVPERKESTALRSRQSTQAGTDQMYTRCGTATCKTT